uniref:RNA polymerase II subunit B1 CTD phosphatase RPAP2 homolog n=1 Tax=Astyanax mexicanus TaxID=7994 RepID=A0A8B9KXE7_ASTMX
MDAGEKRRVRSSKGRKKGELKLREVLKETLREKLELERRARQVVERLLDDSVTEELLIDCARLITPANYKDAVEERSIAKMCGYPVCPNKLTIVRTLFIITKKKIQSINHRKRFFRNFQSILKYSNSFISLLNCSNAVFLQGGAKDPPLPPVDSHAQRLIQKRIAVEKLSRSLQDIVGPLRLTMNDVMNDINNLVRTFRLTNTNIIHKPPEWTLIAVVLLSVLTEVSPLLNESMATPSSVQYISSLMKELQLEDQDLQNLVQLFRPRPQISSTHLH